MYRSALVRFGRITAQPPHAEPGQRIGLLGGSFNPPHAAHRLVSEIALKRLALDKVWWIVTPGNPLKTHGELAPLAERIAACRALIDDTRIEVTGFEADLPSAYTAATLAFLSHRYPRVHFVWVMGADNLAGFHRWQQWREIFSLMPIAVVDRPGLRMKALASQAARAFAAARIPELRAAALPLAGPPAWTMLTGPLSPLSSTEMRRSRIVAEKSQKP
jgi:nicotinate-nucleotide adenylyltransferase